MTTLSQAPLIEVIFEIRWGEEEGSPQGGLALKFPDEDQDLFKGRFQAAIEGLGFTSVERPYPAGIPHVPSLRFRRAPNTWPCYQVGLGIFTTNQINDGYDWSTFKENVLQGIHLFDKTRDVGLADIPNVMIELRYQDGFMFGEYESATAFLSDKLEITFDAPSEFIKSELLEENIEGQKLQFMLKSKIPNGVTSVTLEQGLINGQPGFVMNTAVRSSNEQFTPSSELMPQWLEEAHEVHRHAFRTLISPTYARTFK